MLGVFVVLLTFPAFVAGFFLFYGHVCAIPANALARMFGAALPHWLGSAGGHLRLPPGFALGASASWWWSPSPRSCSSAAT